MTIKYSNNTNNIADVRPFRLAPFHHHAIQPYFHPSIASRDSDWPQRLRIGQKHGARAVWACLVLLARCQACSRPHMGCTSSSKLAMVRLIGPLAVR